MVLICIFWLIRSWTPFIYVLAVRICCFEVSFRSFVHFAIELSVFSLWIHRKFLIYSEFEPLENICQYLLPLYDLLCHSFNVIFYQQMFSALMQSRVSIFFVLFNKSFLTKVMEIFFVLCSKHYIVLHFIWNWFLCVVWVLLSYFYGYKIHPETFTEKAVLSPLFGSVTSVLNQVFHVWADLFLDFLSIPLDYLSIIP